MQSGLVHQVLARELGGAWRRDLVEFDDDPAAAASIGQVHRGRWRDGREVAIKVQFPGAGDAVMSDLRQLSRAARLFAGLIPGLDVKPLIEELRARVAEELDYRLEADAQRRFAAEFVDDPMIVVPGVVANTETVLVSEWLESSRSLARLIADGTQAERDHFGEVYVRFLFSGPDRTGLLHADPHPGNFRLMGDGRMGVVDYGAVARLPDGALPRIIGRLLRRAVDDDYDAVLDGLRDAGFVRPGIELDVDDLRGYLGPFVEPAAVERFQFSREWMRGQFDRLHDPRQTDFSTMLKINLPPDFLLIHRVWLGGIGVLSQLGAEAPFERILSESLPEFAQRS
jgi:predicted unusual protein kinase regulating ubiquinone biosynthesis (AarF/ABC1/UbiB family)